VDHGGLAQESGKALRVTGTTPVRMGDVDIQPGAFSERVMYRASKRLFDLVVSSVAVVALLPVLIAIALVIKLDSPGPVLYKGLRTGMNGVKFRIWKFRTMTVDAEIEGTTTVIGDRRITRVGKILRHTKLDESPQFFNVLAGSMSIVGPRPEVDEHTSEYTEAELAILTVKPGITDYSSLRFFDMARELGSENPHEQYVTKVRGEKNLLRMKYVKESSFLTDLKIVCMTILTVVRRLLGLA
jgi:lipopolysaccharide/colanic/teichoic acid biosynthesis glycosyltransferase